MNEVNDIWFLRWSRILILFFCSIWVSSGWLRFSMKKTLSIGSYRGKT
jgi:hypothetical protein